MDELPPEARFVRNDKPDEIIELTRDPKLREAIKKQIKDNGSKN